MLSGPESNDLPLLESTGLALFWNAFAMSTDADIMEEFCGVVVFGQMLADAVSTAGFDRRAIQPCL
eukprot:gene12639-biopygen3921